jgi:superfamily II DNA helicase RecQ
MKEVRHYFPQASILALTATATETVIHDVKLILQMDSAILFRESFNRTNLKFNIVTKNPKLFQNDIIELIKHKHTLESGIIYCTTKKQTENLCQKLKTSGIKASFFHSDLKPAYKQKVLEAWQKGDLYYLKQLSTSDQLLFLNPFKAFKFFLGVLASEHPRICCI